MTPFVPFPILRAAAPAIVRASCRAIAILSLVMGVASPASAQVTAAADTYTIGKPPQGQSLPMPLRVPAYTGLLGNDTYAAGATMTVALGAGPTRGTVVLNTDGSFVYTPAAAFVTNGGDTFTYTASDGATTSAAATVTLTYDGTAAIYTGDIIRMRVLTNGTPSVWVAGVCSGTSCPTGKRGYVRQYYGESSWGTKVWLGTGAQYGGGSIAGSPWTAVSNDVVPLTDGNGNDIGASIVSVFDLATTGLRVTQTFTYYRGNRYLTKKWRIDNTTGGISPALRLFHGGDTYFGDYDSASGFYDPAKSMVYVRNQDYANWGLMGFYANPATPATAYFEGQFQGANPSGTPPAYPNTVVGSFVDAGYGLQWNEDGIAAGASWTVEAFEVWTEGGSAQVLAPAAQNVGASTVVTLPFSVQNLSPSSMTFTLAASTTAGWTASIPEGTTVILGQNQSATVNVQITVPAGLADGTASNVTLVASALGNTASASTTLTVVNLPVDISLPEIDFTAIIGGQQVVTIENTGNAPFTFGTIATQSPFGTTSDTCSGAALAVGATCTVTVTFTQNTPGTYSANLNIPVVSPVLITRTIPLSASVGGPTAADDSYATPVNTALTVNAANGVLANDTDPGAMTAILAAAPQHGTLTLNANGGFTYTPDNAFVGADTFTYRANNGTASSTARTVTITVSAPSNIAPAANADSYTVNEDATLTVDAASGVLANDTDADTDPLTAVLGTGPSHGTLTLNANGSFTYTPTANYSGSDSFTYVANDGTVNSAAATVSLTVSPVTETPVATADSYTVNEDATLTVNVANGVLANDTDADTDPLTAVLGTGPAHGTLVLNADGSFTYTPTANYFGADSFTYVANDGTVASSAATVTLTVDAVNDLPTLDQPSAATARWDAGAQTITLTGISAGGGESDTLTVTAVSGTPGTAVASAVTYGGGTSATFTLTPVVGRQGAVTITVAVNDGTATTTRTFTFTVTAPLFYLTGVYPATGPDSGGTNVRISGGGFLSQATVQRANAAIGRVVAPQVFIGGMPVAAVVVESDTVISAITPALPAGAPLDVQVIVPAGAGTLPGAFTPYTRPAPPTPPTEPTDPQNPGQPTDPGTPPPDPTNPNDPTAPTTDTDGDGISDVWEEFYGTDPNDASDANADPDGDGKTNKEEFDSNTHPDSRAVRYFAEGNAQAPFRTWVNMYNPSPIEAAINITFYLDDATVVHHLVKAAGGARTTVDTSTVAGIQGHAFGMRVDADESVVINRTITWNDLGIGAAAERGVELSSQWYFAEGATHGPLQTFALLTNPADQPATVEIEYLVSAAGARVSRTHIVPAHSRYTVWVNQEGAELQDQGFGMAVRSSHPIVAERATYITEGSLFEAGETSVGAPAAGQDWYFAEGVAGPVFNTFLLLANPTATAAEVQVRYLPESGAEVVTTHTVAPYGRVTIPVSDEAAWDASMGFGTHVHVTNGIDIVAERAMWWSTDADAGTWEEGHGSAGSATLHTAYAIGDGVAGGAQGASTYVLLANPGTSAAEVQVTLAFEDGTAPVSTSVTIPAGRRVTINAAALFPTADGKRFSATVQGTNSVPFLAEQSIYWTFGTGAWRSGVSLPATPLQ